MLAAVVVILALVSVNAQSVLPPAREPTVTVKMDCSNNVLSLYHKGGDSIGKDDLKIMVSKEENLCTFCDTGDCTRSFEIDPGNNLFDLGSTISCDLSSLGISPPFTVKLATPRTVLFTGEVRP